MRKMRGINILSFEKNNKIQLVVNMFDVLNYKDT